MAFSFFDDSAHQPEDAELAEVLAETKRYWDDLRSVVRLADVKMAN